MNLFNEAFQIGVLAQDFFLLRFGSIAALFNSRDRVVARFGARHVAGDHHLVIADPLQDFRQKLPMSVLP